MASSVLYNLAHKQIPPLKQELLVLENGSLPINEATKNSFLYNLENYKKAIDDYNEYAKREISLQKRELAQSRVTEFKNEYTQMKSRFNQMVQKLKEQEERQALFQRQDPASKPIEDTAIPMDDYYFRESERLHNIGGGIDTFIAQGSQALKDLREQGSMLKNTQRRILDAANTLGLSRTLIQYIDRRSAQDSWVLFGGMIVTVIIIWALIHYLG